MTSKKQMDKNARVKKEVNRLKRIFKIFPEETQKVVEGLIVEAAELRIRLEDIREDLDKNGYDEMFSQSPDTEPYERERPQARRYISMNKNYQSIMKQLGDHIPKKIPNADEVNDLLMDFAGER